MKRWPGVVLFIISGFYHNSLFAQNNTDCETNPPKPPVLLSVSIEPQTGMTELKWELSPSPDVIAYIVYSEMPNQSGLDTIAKIMNPLATSFTYYDSRSQYKSLPYSISAYRIHPSKCTSVFSNSLITIFSQAEIDTCKRKLTIRWNKYSDNPFKVERYDVIITKKDGSTAVYSTSPDLSELILMEFDTDTEYTYYVRAVLENGTVSTSKNNRFLTSMTRPPDWINADFATVNDDGKISISFTIDARSEINRYRLERREGYTGAFQQIADLQSTNGKIIYTDEKASAERINFYRLSAINFCNLPVTISNLSSNISLSLVQDITNISLMWNHYRQWRGSVSGYRVFFDPGDGYRELALVNDTMYTFPYSGIMNQVNGDNICFRVEANEASNPYVPAGESLSSSKCLAAVEVITVPNLFTPDGDAINDYFKPVLSFIPVKYQLLITDIRGKKVFETHNYDETWDGTFKGDLLPADVYLWFVKITGPSGKNFTKNGTVTIFRHH
jgi:gliding motility-associated-like protein